MVEDIGFPLFNGSSAAAVAAVQCSAKGCRANATWQLRWNNPKIHADSARKTWLACPDHRESLGSFLGARSFLREVEPFPAPDDPTPQDSAPPGSAPPGSAPTGSAAGSGSAPDAHSA